MEYVEKYREKLLESVAETSDEFMERYFAGEEFSVEEIVQPCVQKLWKVPIVPGGYGI